MDDDDGDVQPEIGRDDRSDREAKVRDLVEWIRTLESSQTRSGTGREISSNPGGQRRHAAVKVLRESPGTWGGRTLVLFQDAMPRARRLLGPGADLGSVGDVGEPLAWRLVTSDGKQLTAKRIRLVEAVELLPRDWQQWPRDTHEEVMLELEEMIGSQNADPQDAEYLKRLQSGLEDLQAELKELETSERPISPEREATHDWVRLERKKWKLSHQFALAAGPAHPKLGGGQYGAKYVCEAQGVPAVVITNFTDRITVEQPEDLEVLGLRVKGFELAPKGRRQFKLEPEDAGDDRWPRRGDDLEQIFDWIEIRELSDAEE